MRYRSLLLNILLCLIAFGVQAQDIREKPSILRTGPGLSYFSGHEGSRGVPRMGLSIALAPTFTLSEQFYLKPELAFSMKGGKIEYNSSGVFNGSVRYRINYFELPLLLGIRPLDWLAFELGGYGAVEVGGNFDFTGTFSYGYGVFDRDDLNDFDYGVTMGVVFRSRRLHLGIRYYHGLQEVSSGSASHVLLGDAAMRTFQLTLQKVRQRKRRW